MSLSRDRALEELIVSNLKRDSRIDIHELDVRVDNGIVYLSGSLDSAAERRAVQEDIMLTVEPDKLADSTTLRNFVERTDEELKFSVLRVLARDIVLDARYVEVAANDGIVTLSGHVSSYAQKSDVETVAWWTPGVVDVVSRLLVDGLTEPTEESDY